jgi:hypothetical protein
LEFTLQLAGLGRARLSERAFDVDLFNFGGLGATRPTSGKFFTKISAREPKQV